MFETGSVTFSVDKSVGDWLDRAGMDSKPIHSRGERVLPFRPYFTMDFIGFLNVYWMANKKITFIS